MLCKQATKTLYNQRQIEELTNQCCDNIYELLDSFGVKYKKSSNYVYGACPVHGGDNPEGWCLYPDGYEVRGIWVCYTHNCHKIYKQTLPGLIFGLLKRDNDKATFYDAVKWMMKFLGYKSLDEIKICNDKRYKYNKICDGFARERTVAKGISRKEFRKSVKIPAPYYLKRGYSASILNKYDVGQLEEKAVIPVYNDDYKEIIGVTKRSIFNKCGCGYYHNPSKKCPETERERFNSSKWQNSDGFITANHLFNYWFARPYIIKSAQIILVEGPGDCLKLEGAGIHNSVALFGTGIGESQISLIESTWANSIILAMDTDTPGQEATRMLMDRFRRTHYVHSVTYNKKDIGDCTIQELKEIFA